MFTALSIISCKPQVLYHLPAYASYRIKPVMVKQATEATAEMMT